jgi:hypothetical protein
MAQQTSAGPAGCPSWQGGIGRCYGTVNVALASGISKLVPFATTVYAPGAAPDGTRKVTALLPLKLPLMSAVIVATARMIFGQ